MTVHARYLAPDGTPLSGALVFRAPATLTFPQADVILGGPVTVPLDAQGSIEVTLPATDSPDMDPSGWAYIVTEQLSGIPVGRSYNIVLPKALPEVDLADIAPTDPAKPNYVGVAGPVGPQGPTGTPGSRIHSGTAAPAADLGLDGDLYVRYETSTFLGVISTTVSTWQRTAGTWAQLGGDVRGAAWYVNTTTTPSTNTRPGDLLLRTDTGDLWQRGASGWGTPVGNLRGPTGATGAASTVPGPPGPKGDTGPASTVPGPQGPKGDPGAGSVSTVNGSAGPDVVITVAGKTGTAIALTAADVGAQPTGTAVLLTGTQTVAGAKTFSSVPSSSVAPTADTHLARKSYVDSLGGSTWLPADLGFTSWTFDPATSNSGQNLLAGYVYLCGINLRVPTTVTNVCFYSCGYGGGTLNASSFAGLYTAAGARVGVTAALSTIFTPNEGATVVCPLTTAYSAPAGTYWVAIVTNGQTASPYNGPVLARGANLGTSPAGAAAMPGAFRRAARLTATGQTSLPASFTPASGLTYDANAIWAAVA
ncbi:phage tail protein [Streptomyces sp. NBC_00539]|uniref:phage tail protein n=1 Tax=Streptomyces sp. NBC_00539 TaxID=2975770 RepID=UPI002E80083D|nr:phage tail protein [Streptomyces sp. NBC_00539]WUC65844.1 collagen-like protein [Streptomyces sp. NBC_00539]